MTVYCQRNGGQEAGGQDTYWTNDSGIHYSFASAQENKNFTQYPLDWTYDFTKAYLHGMPPSREYMYCFPETSAPRGSSQRTIIHHDSSPSQPPMERSTLKQKLQNLRALSIPQRYPLPSTDRSCFHSALSKTSQSTAASDLHDVERSSQLEEHYRDIADGTSFDSSTAWTSPAMTVAVSTSPASSFCPQQAPRLTTEYQPAFSQYSPVTNQGFQRSMWSHCSPTASFDHGDNHIAELSSNVGLQASYDTVPILPVQNDIGMPYEQTAFMSASSWHPATYSAFHPASMLQWTQDGQIASSGFSWDTMHPTQYIAPTQLVSQTSPAESTMSPQTVHSEESDHSIQQTECTPTWTQHNDQSSNDVENRVLPTSDERQAKDDVLIRLRNQGLSYREIKRQTGFAEAESTLRGRIRVLSKPAHQRVRKPTWRRSDILLLEDAMRMYHGSSSPVKKRRMRRDGQTTVTFRPPWQKVAAYVLENGGSYPFSASACAKKWIEVAGSLGRDSRR